MAKKDLENQEIPAEETVETPEINEEVPVEEPVEAVQEPAVDWQKKYEDAHDAHLRLAAEFDNFRKRSIKEKSIVCLECGKTFKVITKKHLILHGLDAVSYRAKWGLKKGTPLTCKELQRARRQKMKDMKLWEKRAMAREAAK